MSHPRNGWQVALLVLIAVSTAIALYLLIPEGSIPDYLRWVFR